jgi:hypothetical protein
MSELAQRPKDLKRLLRITMKAQRPAFIWGPPGIGKSDLVATIGKEDGRPIIDIRLLVMEPTDIKGMPYYDPDSKSMRWGKPSELPEAINKEFSELRIAEQEQLVADMVAGKTGCEDVARARKKLEYFISVDQNQNAILFLDELNAAPPAVQAAAYQLILNRRVGEYVLPEGVSVVAAGNRETDKGVTFTMPTPLRNRFIHFEMTHHFGDWQNWAINAGVNADVIGFLSQFKHRLFEFDPKSPDKAFPTPRTWALVGQLLDVEPNLRESDRYALVAGSVGQGVTNEFLAHCRVAAKMPTPEEVLTGKKTKWDIKEISAAYALVISMCYTLKDWAALAKAEGEAPEFFDTKNGTVEYDIDEWHKNFDFFLTYIMDNFQPEMIILGAKTALRDFELKAHHSKLTKFKEFHKEYGKYILSDD